jgi:hypothetical protein
MTTHHGHLDFSSEDWDKPVQFFDGCWVIASRHNPGLLSSMELNNRVFVFRLRGRAGKDVLLVFGCGGASTLAGVRAIEKQTGTNVGWVVGNGGGHHLFLSLWYEAFPQARVLVPAKRVPFTRNGQELQRKYAARWELMHGPRPKQLVDEFGSEIDVVIFDQLFHYKDENVARIMASPKDHTSPPASLSGFSLLMAMGKAMKDTSHPNDEVTLFHRASGLVVGGHNFQFSFTPKGSFAAAEVQAQVGRVPDGFLDEHDDAQGEVRLSLRGPARAYRRFEDSCRRVEGGARLGHAGMDDGPQPADDCRSRSERTRAQAGDFSVARANR